MSKLPFSPSNKNNNEQGDRKKLSELSDLLAKSVHSVVGPKKAKLGDWDVLVFGEPDAFMEISIPSSKAGEFYGVVVSKTGIICHCRGYGFRNTCRHITEVRQALDI